MIEFNTKEENLHFHGVIDIDPKELATMLEDSSQQKQIQLIDVRQPDEFHGDLGHIPGATLMVLDTLPDLVDKVDKDKTVVFVCRSGGRSARAAAYFQSLGYKNVFNLKGGMLLWSELHLETEA
jgi:hydroxyacylglutathione hydrolase